MKIEMPQQPNRMMPGVEKPAIREEADRMLREYGILEALRVYGEPYLHGSYELDLMVWPELDIYLLVSGFQSRHVYKIIESMHDCVPPTDVLMTNKIDHASRFGPSGYVHIDYMLMHSDVEWKIDLGVVDKNKHQWPLREYNSGLLTRLTPELRSTIVDIKTKAVCSSLYRRSTWQLVERKGTFYSGDIITAVLDHGVADFDGFTKFLRSQRGIDFRSEELNHQIAQQ